MVKLLLDGIGLELALVVWPKHFISAVLADPLEAVIREKLHHFLALLFVLVTFLDDFGDFSDFARVTSHPQLLILKSQSVYLE